MKEKRRVKRKMSAGDRYISEITFETTAKRVSAVTIAGNILLSIFKLVAGIIGRSSAMISDAIHSASDVLSTVIVLIGVKLAAKQPDKEHPYGHERLECVAAIVLSMILFLTGAGRYYRGELCAAADSGTAFADCSGCFDCRQRSNVSVHKNQCGKN